MFYRSLAGFLLALSVSLGCSDGTSPTKGGPPDPTWVQVWSHEFDGASGTPIDATKWQPDSVSVSGIDGLAFANGVLIAHHAFAFWKIARYPLDPTWRRIVGRQLIEANSPDGLTSTTGELIGRDYVYIGNSQIDRMNAKTIDAATMDPIPIYRVRLPSQ